MKTGTQKKERTYYEVFGDTLNQVYFFRTLVIILAAVCIFLLLMLQKSLEKPPLVVKVDEIGRVEPVKDWDSSGIISKPEVYNFVSTFMDLFTAYDFYHYDDDFKKVFKMMTKEYSVKADDCLESNKIIDTIKQAQYKTNVNIPKMVVIKDSGGFLIVKVTGYREHRSYINVDFYKQVIFESELVLKKVKRTFDTPWGMLVDNYSETVMKQK